MKYLITIIISVGISVGCIYYYDKNVVQNYYTFSQVVIADSEGNQRAVLGNFGEGENTKVGLALYNKHGQMRQFVGITDESSFSPEMPHLVLYSENGVAKGFLSATEETGTSLVIGGINDKGSITVSSSNNTSSITMLGSGEKPSELALFSGVSPSIALFNKETDSVTAIHSSPKEPSVIVVQGQNRVWTTPK